MYIIYIFIVLLINFFTEGVEHPPEEVFSIFWILQQIVHCRYLHLDQGVVPNQAYLLNKNLILRVMVRKWKKIKNYSFVPFGMLIWIFVHVLAELTSAGQAGLKFNTVHQRVWNNNSRDLNADLATLVYKMLIFV